MGENKGPLPGGVEIFPVMLSIEPVHFFSVVYFLFPIFRTHE